MGTPHLAPSWVPLEPRSTFGNAAMQRFDEDERLVWAVIAVPTFPTGLAVPTSETRPQVILSHSADLSAPSPA